MNKNTKQLRRDRRRGKIRSRISGTSSRPRLSVFKSNRGMFLQIIDDEAGKTLVSASSKETKEGTKTEKAKELGKIIAEKAIKEKIKTVVFDRGGFQYHGRIKAVADGAREAGLEF